MTWILPFHPRIVYIVAKVAKTLCLNNQKASYSNIIVVAFNGHSSTENMLDH
jgi:uncharacterized protein YccT (UPF0319 family)